MGSLGSGELLVIAVAALIVFGPKRLPEIARKASELLTKTREATQSVTSALDKEFDGVTAPLQSLKDEYQSTMKEIKGAATSVGDAALSAGDSTKASSNPAAPAGDMAVTMPLDDELPGSEDSSVVDAVDSADAPDPSSNDHETSEGESTPS